ncbi:MAG: GIY-YIG nuclease family protein [Pedobacter sp.]|nr:MAG: GIY-YIG nuclease family protein [Pedobacter sp.]
MSYFAYVLRSLKVKRRYIGMSENPDKRLLQHNAGSTKSTKGYRPWELIYKEEFETLQEARSREVFLKSGIGREFLDRLHL